MILHHKKTGTATGDWHLCVDVLRKLMIKCPLLRTISIPPSHGEAYVKQLLSHFFELYGVCEFVLHGVRIVARPFCSVPEED